MAYNPQTTPDAWRYNLAALDNHISMIKQHVKTLRERTERPKYLAYAEKRLAEHLKSYLVRVRRVSECEAAMTEAGVEFRRP